ncbi:MAG: pyridoxamine 5'-phosphate oxidase family protein [Clostridia bacterium]
MKKRTLRRKKQELTEKEILSVIARNDYGVLSIAGKDGMSYGVPLNYVYEDGCFYFHCAVEGHKLELIDENEKASFCIVDHSTVIPETFSTDYISVIAFGTVARIAEDDEKRRTLTLLADVLGIDDEEAKRKEVESSYDHVEMLCFRVEHMTGKGSMSVIKDKERFFAE